MQISLDSLNPLMIFWIVHDKLFAHIIFGEVVNLSMMPLSYAIMILSPGTNLLVKCSKLVFFDHSHLSQSILA